jgi:hypothetical protein
MQKAEIDAAELAAHEWRPVPAPFDEDMLKPY